MKSNKICILLLCFFTTGAFAQVGIGTVLPTAQLEIANDPLLPNVALLELNPQTSPTGTATGQLAVIGDQLYMYDATRAKWLSVETTALQYGYAQSCDNQELFFGGDIGLELSTEGLTGAKMPFDGTMVYMTIQSSGGFATKSFEIVVNGTPVPNSGDDTIDGRINLTANTFTRTTYNIDFDAGDYIAIKARNPGAAVEDPAAIIWVKWRQ